MLEQIFDRSQLFVYGHSFTQPDGEMCDPGEEWMPKLAAALGCPSWETYGVGSSRLIDVYADIARQGYANPVANSGWKATRNGIVVLQAETNDMISPAFGGVTAATAVSGKALGNYQNTLMAALATLSASSIIDLSDGTGSGTWSTSSSAPYGNGNLVYTTQQGAYREFSVDIGPSGVLWLITWDVSSDISNPANGEINISVDGTSWMRESARTSAWQTIYSRRSGDRNVGPRAIRITDLPAGVHTIRFTKNDSGPGAVYLDRLLVIDEAPPVIVTKDPFVVDGTSWVTNAANLPIMQRNRRFLHGKIDAAVSYFPNVITASLSAAEAEHFGPDGVHFNNDGMTFEADILERAIRSFTDQYMVDRMYA